jgi:DNA repair protein RadD
MILREYQQRTIDQLYAWFASGKEGNPCLVLPTGCHAAGTKVIMFDGSTKNVENVVVGDSLMGPDSLPRKVLALCRGSDDMYRITPKKGEPFVVNGGHILSLACTNEGKNFPSSAKSGNYENVSINDYLGKSKAWKHLRKLHRAHAIEFSQKPEPELDPWAIGVLLGDGHIVSSVMICNPDAEIIDEMRSIMASHGLAETIRQKPGNPAFDIRYVDPRSSRTTANKVMSILRKLGIAGTVADNKFVPLDVKTGSKKTRLNVLAGLLDTDGHYDGKCFDYISKSKQLSDDVVFMCRSLGLWAKSKECHKTCQTGGGGTYWRVCISGDLDIIPTRVVRKQADSRKQKKNPLVTGFSIEHVGHFDFFGFTLDRDHLYVTDDFVVHHNSGKSVIIAELCRNALHNWPNTRVLMLTHVKELIEQNAQKMRAVWPNAPMGIYSASVGQKNSREPITFAGIQSVRKKAALFGHIDLVLVDECHLISHKDEGGYRSFISDLMKVNPALRVVGLTATPWRLGHGRICDGDALFSDLIEPVSIEELIYLGHLAPLKSKVTDLHFNLSGVHKRGGEWVEGELARAVDTETNNHLVVREIIARAEGRKSWLIFCAGVKHAQHIAEILAHYGVKSGCITGDTPKREREGIIADFRAGRITALTNANVLTTGFDAPDIDLIAMLRPTMSPSLYVQMAGRGLRPKSHTDHCLVLDFAGNVQQHGPITCVREPARKGEGGGEAPAKLCDACGEIVAISARICPACGAEFPAPEEKVYKLRNDDIMGAPAGAEEMEVTGWTVRPTVSRTSGLDMIQVTYYGALSEPPIREYLTVFHEGYAGQKALAKLATISTNSGVPADMEDWRSWCKAVTEEGKRPASIKFVKNGKFYNVTERTW